MRVHPAAVAPLVVMALAACAHPAERGPQEITGWSNGGDVINVDVHTCDGDPVASVVEDETTVTVTVTSTDSGWGAECVEDSLKVELDAPLDDRTVIDGVTGEEPPGIEG
ncbi:hypothetical protein [Demequina maris]|uniref:hypothetical protein n=1 Tax=Demequina maris TaxID=1638982 RepID=UPI0007852A1C|nr:hypothetical protein [Demequina maris]